VAKAAARELIDRLADQGAPNLDGAIEIGQPISFASMILQSLVRNVDASRGAVAFAETSDAPGLMFWLFRDQVLAKIEAGIDEIADDKAALSSADCERLEAEIAASVGRLARCGRRGTGCASCGPPSTAHGQRI
jgi:hypothetical protein